MTKSEIATLRFDIECLDRHIKTLEDSLDKSRTKRNRMFNTMVNSCNHEYEDTGDIWDSSIMSANKDSNILMRCQECKYCSKTKWSKL